MIFAELIFALLIAVLLTLVFAAGFRGHGLGAGLLLFFFILFLATWAGGVWVTPFGPLWFGVPWLSFLVIGVLLALMLAALLPDRRRQGANAEIRREARADIQTLVALDVFFWLLIGALAIAVIFGYLLR